MKKNTKDLATVGVIAVLGLGAAFAVPAALGSSGGNGSSGGGGGSLGGYADEIDYGEGILSFDDFLNLIPAPEEEGPSLLDTPPIYPHVEPVKTTETATETGSFWSSLMNSFSLDEATKEKATSASKTAWSVTPYLAPLPTPVKIAAAGGVAFGTSLGANAVNQARDFVNRNQPKSPIYDRLQPATSTKSSSGSSSSKKSGGSGFGSAKVIDPPKKSTGSGMGGGGIGGGGGGGFGGAR